MMKKEAMRLRLLMITVFVCLWVSMTVHADEPSVTLTVNGSTANSTILAEQNCTVVIRAPGATGVRLWDPNENCWRYWDSYNPLGYLEVRWRYSAGLRMVYAYARYDDYQDEAWVGDEAYEDQWTASSNIIRLTVRADSGTLPAPAASLDAASVSRAGWLTARITQTLGLGEWYWADVMRVSGDQFEQLNHYDFNAAGELDIHMGQYEPGNYQLFVFNGCGGYAHGETRLPFTVTASANLPTGLMVSDETVPAGTEVFISGYNPGANRTEFLAVKRDNPTWRDHRYWEGGQVFNTWQSMEPGIYDLTLTAWNDDEQLLTDTAVLTVTAPETDGQLSKPDLSGFPSILTEGEGFAGTIQTDPRSVWMGITITWCPENAEWEDIYRSDREAADGDGWNLVSLPADLFERSGRYRLHVDTNTPGLAGNHTETLFLKTDSAPGDLSLTVNGSTSDISQWNSNKNLSVSAVSETATAVRILNNDWWEYEDMRGGRASWNFGYGDGDYNIVAQMTTAEPVWRDENFDWGSFNWEDLPWTTLSNVVKVHVTSPNGTLDTPQVSLTPADGVAARGEWLTVESAPQGHGEWMWLNVCRLETDNGSQAWWNDVEHFDSGGASRIRIPTAMLEPGDYYLRVGIGAGGWASPGEVNLPIRVLEPEEDPDPSLQFSRDTMPANENVTVYGYAPGAEHIDIDVRWDADPYWEENFNTGGGWAAWNWGCGSGGVYTFTMKAYYPEESGQDPLEIVRTFTVTSDGELDRPVLTDVPSVMHTGEAVNGSFQNIEGAQWYNVELQYAPDNGDWEQWFREDRDPEEEGANELNLEGSLFGTPGRYRLSVNAGAPGKNNGYTEHWILVLEDEPPAQGLLLQLFGTADQDQIDDLYLYQDVKVSVMVPEGVTGVRVWDGRDWHFWGGGYETYRSVFDAFEEGMLTYVAQATTDQSVTEWGEAHDGDFWDFDWNSVSWTMTSNIMSVNVICNGDLPAPVIHVPEGDVLRGEWLEASFEAVENTYIYGVLVVPENGDWGQALFEGEYFEAGPIRIPTDNLEPGNYRLVVDPRRYGWRGHAAEHSFTVAEPQTWNDEPVFRIGASEVLTNEKFAVSVYAPGAQEVRFCHEDVSDEWYSGEESISGMVSCEYPDTYVFRAYARYEGGEDWVQIGTDQTVEASAPYGMREGIINAPSLAVPDEEITFSFTWRHMGSVRKDGWINLYNDQGGEILDLLGDDELSVIEDLGEEEDTFTFTIAPGVLSPGSYRIECVMKPDDTGFEPTEVKKTLFVLEDGGEKIITNLQDQGEYLTREMVPVSVYAPGAAHITVYANKSAPVPENESTLRLEAEGDTLEDEMVIGGDASRRYVKIRADYEDGTCETRELEVSLIAPYGDMIGPLIWMDDVWTEGQPLSFRVEPQSAVFIYVDITDTVTGEVVYEDEDINFDNWSYTIPADHFAPGRWYSLYVYSTEVGYNANETTFDICMMPDGADTMTLPAALTQVDEEAFAGIAAQRLTLPEDLETAASRAFADCPNLLLVDLPEDCSGIADDAFEGCGPLIAYGPMNESALELSMRTDVNYICLNP